MAEQVIRTPSPTAIQAEAWGSARLGLVYSPGNNLVPTNLKPMTGSNVAMQNLKLYGQPGNVSESVRRRYPGGKPGLHNSHLFYYPRGGYAIFPHGYQNYLIAIGKVNLKTTTLTVAETNVNRRFQSWWGTRLKWEYNLSIYSKVLNRYRAKIIEERKKASLYVDSNIPNSSMPEGNIGTENWLYDMHLKPTALFRSTFLLSWNKWKNAPLTPMGKDIYGRLGVDKPVQGPPRPTVIEPKDPEPEPDIPRSLKEIKPPVIVKPPLAYDTRNVDDKKWCKNSRVGYAALKQVDNSIICTKSEQSRNAMVKRGYAYKIGQKNPRTGRFEPYGTRCPTSGPSGGVDTRPAVRNRDNKYVCIKTSDIARLVANGTIRLPNTKPPTSSPDVKPEGNKQIGPNIDIPWQKTIPICKEGLLMVHKVRARDEVPQYACVLPSTRTFLIKNGIAQNVPGTATGQATIVPPDGGVDDGSKDKKDEGGGRVPGGDGGKTGGGGGGVTPPRPEPTEKDPPRPVDPKPPDDGLHCVDATGKKIQCREEPDGGRPSPTKPGGGDDRTDPIDRVKPDPGLTLPTTTQPGQVPTTASPHVVVVPSSPAAPSSSAVGTTPAPMGLTPPEDPNTPNTCLLYTSPSPRD